MFTKKATVALLALAFMFVMPLAMTNNSSGASGDVTFDDGAVDIGTFNENSAGRLTITLLNHNTDESVGDEGAITVSAYVTFFNGTDRLDSRENIVIPKKDGPDPGSVRVDFNFRISTPGTHRVTVHVEPEDLFIGDNLGEGGEFQYFNTSTFTISVSSSIWSNTSTYIVIIIVIIVIVVAVFLKMRSNSAGKSKKDTAGVFTAMEAEKRSKTEEPEYDDDGFEYEEDEPAAEKPKAEKPKAEKSQTKSTEKQEYVGKVSSSKSKKSSPQRKSKRR